MGWPPSNTIFASILKGDFGQAADRTKNYVKSGELLTDATNAARLVASGGTDVGAWASAGAKAIGGYQGAGDLTGGYGARLNQIVGAADLMYGGAAKTATSLTSKFGKSVLKFSDKATKLASSSDGILSMINPSPRYDAAAVNQQQSSSALMSNSVGAPPQSFGGAGSFPMSRYEPSQGGTLSDGLKVETEIPMWLIIGGVAAFMLLKK